MISFVKGKINIILENKISVITETVGFWVNLPVSKVSNFILSEGMQIEIYTQMTVREADISLWGFFDKDSCKMFDILLTVSGVGPKTAQSMIFELGVEKIVNSIILGEANKLKVSGVGLKTAEKIIIELKNKIADKFKFADLGDNNQEGVISGTNLYLSEAVEALIALGYRERDVLDAAKNSDLTELGSVQEVIKLLLKKI